MKMVGRPLLPLILFLLVPSVCWGYDVRFCQTDEYSLSQDWIQNLNEQQALISILEQIWTTCKQNMACQNDDIEHDCIAKCQFQSVWNFFHNVQYLKSACRFFTEWGEVHCNKFAVDCSKAIREAIASKNARKFTQHPPKNWMIGEPDSPTISNEERFCSPITESISLAEYNVIFNTTNDTVRIVNGILQKCKSKCNDGEWCPTACVYYTVYRLLNDTEKSMSIVCNILGSSKNCKAFAKSCFSNFEQLSKKVSVYDQDEFEPTTQPANRWCIRTNFFVSRDMYDSMKSDPFSLLTNVITECKTMCNINNEHCIEDCAYQTAYKYNNEVLLDYGYLDRQTEVEHAIEQFCKVFTAQHCKTFATDCYKSLKYWNNLESKSTTGKGSEIWTEETTTTAPEVPSVGSEESAALTEIFTTDASTTTLTSTVASIPRCHLLWKPLPPPLFNRKRMNHRVHHRPTFTEESTTIDPEIVEFRLRRKKMEQEERDEKKRKQEEEEGNGRVWVYVLLPLCGVALLAGIIGGVVFWRVRKSRKERRKREEEENRLSNPRALEAALRKQNPKRKGPPKKETKKPAKAPLKDMHFTPIKKDKFKQEQVLKVEAGVDAATVVYEEEEAVKSRSIKDLDFNFDRNRIVRFGDDVGLDEEKKEEAVANEAVEDKKEKTESKEIAEEKKEIVDEKAEKTETSQTSMVKDASQKTREIEKKEAEDEKKDKKSNKKSEKSEKKSEKTEKKSEKTEKKSEKTEMKEES